MGGTIKRMWRGTPRIRVGVIGLDGVGKTTLVYQWALHQEDKQMPIIGWSIALTVLKYAGCEFTIHEWDLGGQEKIRLLWRDHYYPACNALMFVIDSTDRKQIGADPNSVDEEDSHLLQKELKSFLDDTQKLVHLPIVFVCNKSDVNSADGASLAMSVDEIRERLELDQLLAGRRWHIHSASAVKSEHIHEGLDWIIRGTSAAEEE